ncbi:S1 RNA-binding domain-containing protein [Desulfurobacterium atlanticum]|uniref:Small subunit ribosomal protein S1 n=1 Tax=Desulfurobacterium atlanticum TaxID=240169 RepID=A0A239ACT4_9BACT|nr:S1 RNA-binding domain-containing protein [Desulfurobacterium atlanticum]SNR93182.1 small subunit ribosomal protein S1 [Desulfurobacterium atlanticum]
MKEDFAKLLDEYFKKRKGKKKIIEGTVIKINGKDVFVDYGGKSEGVVPIEEFETLPEIGDKVEVSIVEPETEDGYAILSISTVRTLKKWEETANRLEKEKIVEGIIRQKVRGGYKVDIGSGIYTFLPLSQVDIIPVTRPDDWLDKKIKAKVLSIDRKRQSIVISRRQLIEEERKKKRKEILGSLKEGEVVEGRVKNIVDFGIFVDVKGVDGLVHKSDISWSGLKTPFEITSIGKKIKVKIIKIDKEKERLFLSIKRIHPDPWEKIESIIKEGEKLKGKVAKLSSKGIFIELPHDIAGFIPADYLKNKHLKEHKEYTFTVEKIDREKRRVILSCPEELQR